jgi:hypothetical protein
VSAASELGQHVEPVRVSAHRLGTKPDSWRLAPVVSGFRVASR